MKEYDFMLTFSLQNPNEDPGDYERALEENNCTDALLGVGRKGTIALDFGREGASAYEAISSAITDVERSIPGATLTEIEPDFVGITDIAELVNKSRQNIRKLIFSDESECPPPVHGGNPTIWHLYDILKWLQQHRNYEISQELIEVAEITKSLNTLRAWNQLEPDMRRKAETITTPKRPEITALSL